MNRIALALLTIAAVVVTAVLSQPIGAPLSHEVRLEDMTWVEVREAVGQGKTVVIVPTAGVEQNGPHMVLGKHGYIVRHTAERIARKLGNALVAPVVNHVPEGTVDPASGHMAFAGTVSLPDELFAGIIEHTARSLRAHGFKTICFLGDSGGNQEVQAAVAGKLNDEWAGSGVTVLQVGDYYFANGQFDWLLGQGESAEAIGRHAGIRDTSELLAVFPEGVRADRMKPDGGFYLESTGVDGDPSRATAERGKKLLDLKIEAAVRQIRAALASKGG